MLKSLKIQAVIPGTPNDAREGGLYVRSASRQARGVFQHSDVRRALIRFFSFFLFGLMFNDDG